MRRTIKYLINWKFEIQRQFITVGDLKSFFFLFKGDLKSYVLIFAFAYNMKPLMNFPLLVI